MVMQGWYSRFAQMRCTKFHHHVSFSWCMIFLVVVAGRANRASPDHERATGSSGCRLHQQQWGQEEDAETRQQIVTQHQSYWRYWLWDLLTQQEQEENSKEMRQQIMKQSVVGIAGCKIH